jgi:hypothetical protein
MRPPTARVAVRMQSNSPRSGIITVLCLAACSLWLWAYGSEQAAALERQVYAGQQPGACTGDCGRDGSVTVDELVKGVNIALGLLPVSQCDSFDCDGDGEVAVNELIAAVNAALEGCAGSSTPTATPTPTRSPGATWTVGPGLDLHVSWPAVVEPPQATFAINIEMAEDEANYSDWVVGDVAGSLASGRLGRGESTSATFDVDWTARPLLSSNRLFYVYARADNGSAFAQVVEVSFLKPVAEATPTPTLSCGYANFKVKTEPKLTVRFPDSSFNVEIANEGILQCGDLSWQAVEPASQADALSCLPDHGELAGAQSWGEPTLENIECSIDWSGIPAGQAEDYYLLLFSYPRVNGTDSAHLVEVRLEKPAGAESVSTVAATLRCGLHLSNQVVPAEDGGLRIGGQSVLLHRPRPRPPTSEARVLRNISSPKARGMDKPEQLLACQACWLKWPAGTG